MAAMKPEVFYLSLELFNYKFEVMHIVFFSIKVNEPWSFWIEESTDSLPKSIKMLVNPYTGNGVGVGGKSPQHGFR